MRAQFMILQLLRQRSRKQNFISDITAFAGRYYCTGSQFLYFQCLREAHAVSSYDNVFITVLIYAIDTRPANDTRVLYKY